MEKRLMNIRELSEYISMPVATIYSYKSMGKIPMDCIIKIGTSLKFDVEAVNRWINGVSAAQASAREHIQSVH